MSKQEGARVIEDVDALEYANSMEDVHLVTVGKDIGDGGPTRPVMGDQNWAHWEEHLSI